MQERETGRNTSSESIYIRLTNCLLQVFRYGLIFYSLGTDLNDLRNIICLRKSAVSAKKNLVYNVTENMAKHGIHCPPSSCTNDGTDMLR